MKPSEKIKEIANKMLEEHKKNCIEHGYMCHIGMWEFIDSALLEFLDEIIKLSK